MSRRPARLPLLAAALLAGCASPTPSSEGMIPAFTARQRHPQAVAIEVKDATALPDAAFRQALADAIVLSKVFSRVVEKPGGGNYLLSVSVVKLEQPGRVLDYHFTVKMEAGWTLKRAGTKATVWQATIRSEHTAVPGDAIPGGSRLRLATEGAARENIAAGLARISKLDL